MEQREDAQSTAGSHSIPACPPLLQPFLHWLSPVLRGCEDQERQPVPRLSLPSVAIITLTRAMLPEIAALSVSQNLLLLN